MSKEKKERSAGSSIGVGLLCLVIGGVCLYYGYAFGGWFFLAIGTYGLVSGILQPRFGKDKAANIGTIPTILVIITGLYIHLIAKTNTDWVLASSGASIVALATVAGYGLFSSFKSGTVRVVLKSLAIVAFSIALVFIFHLWAQKVFLLNAVLLFMAAGSLRQGLYELLTGRSEQSTDEAGIYFAPDVFVLALLIGGLVYYRDLLFFHLFVITLALGLFRFSTERFISEISIREHQKIDADYPKQRRKFSFAFFASLTDVHASINLLMLPVLLGYLGLSLEQYVVRFEIQSDVFQASIGVLGIVAGFSTLILGERLRKGDEGWAKLTAATPPSRVAGAQ